MEGKIKQKLGDLAKKKQGGERYEKVQRGSTAEDEDEDEDDFLGHTHAERGGGGGSDPLPGGCTLIVPSTWRGTLRALRDRAGADVAKSVYETKHFPADMYYVFALKFLESYSYFALSQILVLYLHEDFGVSDMEAGMVYGM